MTERIEIRDGKEFKVTVLPDAEPPKNRSAKSRYHMADVGKPGEAGGVHNYTPKPRKRKRKK